MTVVRSHAALEDICSVSGISRLLTSGWANTASAGEHVLRTLVQVRCRRTRVDAEPTDAAAESRTTLDHRGRWRRQRRQCAAPRSLLALRTRAGAYSLSYRCHRTVSWTGVREVHASARALKWGGMVFRRGGVYMGGEKRNGLEAEYATKVADEDAVRDLISEANGQGQQVVAEAQSQ